MKYKVDNHILEMLNKYKECGCEIEDEVFENTPDRVERMYSELLSGYHQSPAKILERTFQVDYNEMILVTGIEFFSMCEHHMLPFHGKAHVAYLPAGRVVGISKLVRLVECFSRRLQLQERATSQIANSLMEYLEPQGAAVVLIAEHMCMSMRGVNKSEARTVTSAMRGIFKDDSKARMEFLQLIQMNGGSTK